MGKEITIKKQEFSLSNPASMTKLAEVLKEHIKKNKLSVVIQNKDYIYVEGWQFAGGMMGLFPKIVRTEYLSKESPNEHKWLAEAQIINAKTQEVMSTGIAICSNTEKKKVSFDEYAVLSMAQTRAIGKAYRNIIGWVMKMTGAESTPAEEIQMDEMPKDKLEEAKGKITACKSVTMLMEYDKKIQSSKKYSKEQKKELGALIKSRSHEIE